MISASAEVHESVILGKDVHIGAGSVIGEGVEIGDGTRIGPYVVVQGPTKIGKNNKIFSFSSVGDEPQDMTYNGEKTELIIGDNNIIREYSMLSRGTVKSTGITVVGNNNFFMAHSHVGHDCVIKNNVILINHSALSGHVVVNDYATIGAYSAVHQFCEVGQGAFVTKATYITKDVLPFVTVAGYEAGVCGINAVGLRRRGVKSKEVDALRRAYKVVFRQGNTVKEALIQLHEMLSLTPLIQEIINGLESSTRGIVR